MMRTRYLDSVLLIAFQSMVTANSGGAQGSTVGLVAVPRADFNTLMQQHRHHQQQQQQHPSMLTDVGAGGAMSPRHEQYVAVQTRATPVANHCAPNGTIMTHQAPATTLFSIPDYGLSTANGTDFGECSLFGNYTEIQMVQQ